VADIIRQHSDHFIDTHGAWLTGQHHRVRDLPLCQQALESRPSQVLATPDAEIVASAALSPCPRCGGTMVVIEPLTAHQIYGRAVAEGIFL
jgi:hypothetical protein